MAARVIQGFFIGGRMRLDAGRATAPAVQRRTTGAPPAPGRSPLVHQPAAVAQRFGDGESFAIDPVQIGLARGGGSPLPGAVLAKMEAAFGTDFSGVRVHIGPQASRIGAVAFTMGDDLYFAPGQFQPESVKGQQLIGHELAHVIQQRQGRVRAAGSGVAVVQDRALEAEADRLGMRAAAHRGVVQTKAGQRQAGFSTPCRAGPLVLLPRHGAAAQPKRDIDRPGILHPRMIQRSQELVVVQEEKQPFKSGEIFAALPLPVIQIIIEYLIHNATFASEFRLFNSTMKNLIDSRYVNPNDWIVLHRMKGQSFVNMLKDMSVDPEEGQLTFEATNSRYNPKIW